MDNLNQFAKRIAESRNLRMIVASLKSMEQILKDRAIDDPRAWTELNNALFRARMLLRAFGPSVIEAATDQAITQRDFEAPR